MGWDGYATFYLIVGIVHVVAAALVMTGRRPENFLLAALLFTQGLVPAGILMALNRGGFAPFDVPGSDTFKFIVGSIPFVYALFIGIAIRHRSTAWLRTGWARIVVLATWATAMVLALGYDMATVGLATIVLGGLVSLYALVASVLYWRASTGVRRVRACWYLASFALRDIGIMSMTTGQAIYLNGTELPWLFTTGRTFTMIGDLVLVAGLLRGQILAFDHHLLRAVASAIAAALLVGGFVVLTELTEQWLSNDNNVIGIAVAVTLALTFRPLQAVLKRRLRRYFPNAKALHDMTLAERKAAYREQWDLAVADGVVTGKEQDMLGRTAFRLGLDSRQVKALQG